MRPGRGYFRMRGNLRFVIKKLLHGSQRKLGQAESSGKPRPLADKRSGRAVRNVRGNRDSSRKSRRKDAFWPSIPDRSAGGGGAEPDHCLLIQELAELRGPAIGSNQDIGRSKICQQIQTTGTGDIFPIPPSLPEGLRELPSLRIPSNTGCSKPLWSRGSCAASRLSAVRLLPFEEKLRAGQVDHCSLGVARAPGHRDLGATRDGARACWNAGSTNICFRDPDRQR